MSTISGTQAEWKRVGGRVEARRLELGLTIEDALTRARPKISRSVWSNLERGAQPAFKAISLAAVARALAWSSDSIERMLAGEDPVVETPVFDTATPLDRELHDELRALRDEVAELRRKVEEREVADGRGMP